MTPPAYSLDSFAVGDRAVFERSFSAADFQAFSTLSGDRNPLHHDAAFAGASRFGRPIVPLHVTLAPLSMIAGMVFPGQPSLYLGHEVRAAKPVFYDEVLRYSARIERINASHGILGLRVLALRGAEVVLDAAMRVQVLEPSWTTPPALPIRKAAEPALALVTGAAGAIGGAIARALAAAGWRLLLQDRGAEDKRRALLASWPRGAAAPDFIAADLATPQGQAAAAAAIAGAEDLGLVVHAASPGIESEAAELVAVNFSALKAISDAAMPRLLERQGGAVVLIGSVATERALPGWEAYAGAKAMAASLVSGLDRTHSPYGPRGLTLMPGLVATGFSKAWRAEAAALMPQEVAEALLAALAEPGGSALIVEAGQAPRWGRLGFHAESATVAPSASVAPVAAPVSEAKSASSGAAATLIRLIPAAAADLAQAALGSTPGWDSLRHIELLLALEADLGIRFDSAEMDSTHRFAELDALCRGKAST